MNLSVDDAKFFAEWFVRIIELEEKVSRQETCINNLQEAIVIIERELSRRWGE